jgi:hypothetical protein
MIFRTAPASKRHRTETCTRTFRPHLPWLAAAGLLAPALCPTTCPAEEHPEAILRAARMNPLGAPVSLDARLRSGREKTPFRIVVEDDVRYEFADPEQTLILSLGEEGSRLSERTGGREQPVRPARFDERVRGTDISYEDLALKFLYWDNPEIIDTETVRTRRAWKFEIQAPRGGLSQYGVARLWIDCESGALLRMEGYDMRGKLVRRFEVLSAQKIEGQWMLKSMRIESIDPETRRVLSRTYLEVLGKNS